MPEEQEEKPLLKFSKKEHAELSKDIFISSIDRVWDATRNARDEDQTRLALLESAPKIALASCALATALLNQQKVYQGRFTWPEPKPVRRKATVKS